MAYSRTTVIFSAGIALGLLISFLISSFFVLTPVTRVIPTSDGTSNHGDVAHLPRSSDLHEHNHYGNVSLIQELDLSVDSHHHHDDASVANKLYDEVRVLIWIMTSEENLEKKARHVKATWGKRANVALYVSDKENKTFPSVAITVPPGRDHLTAKTFQAFDYVYENYLDQADWFMKADDDTYVIVENLRYMLSAYDTNKPVFFGHHFKTIVKQGYMSGGGGYVISKEALKRLANRSEGECAKDGGAEDAEFGKCMQKLEVVPGDSRDILGRSRFHCLHPENHLHGTYPDWYYQYDKYGGKYGLETLSDYAITFHYIGPDKMYDMEYYIYHLRPHGIVSKNQNLNPLNASFVKAMLLK